MDRIVLAGRLLKFAKELMAEDDRERAMQEMERRFAEFTLENTAESAQAYAALCKEWDDKFPEYLPPVPGRITIPPALREDAKQRRLKEEGPRTLR